MLRFKALGRDKAAQALAAKEKLDFQEYKKLVGNFAREYAKAENFDFDKAQDKFSSKKPDQKS